MERGWKVGAGRRPFAGCLGYPRGRRKGGERVGLYMRIFFCVHVPVSVISELSQGDSSLERRCCVLGIYWQ